MIYVNCAYKIYKKIVQNIDGRNGNVSAISNDVA